MKPGTIVQLPDGRKGTVVYHGLDGYGIQWGEIEVDVEAVLAGAPLFEKAPPGWEWDPEAMLRGPEGLRPLRRLQERPASRWREGTG